MSVFHNNVLAGAAGQGGAAADEYVIPKSLRFNDDDQAYLAKTVASVGDQRRMTFSFWIKRHSISSSSGFAIFAQDYLTSPSNAVIDRSLSMLFDGDRLELYDYGASSGAGDSGSVQAWTAGVVQEGSDDVLFRDPSAWYSVIFAIDTTQSTAANRCKVWINGVQRTMSGYPVQNSYLSWGQVKNHYIGIQKTNGSFTRAGDFSLADVQFIDGQQLSNTDFGEFDSNGIWRPKEASFTNPNNGTTWNSTYSAAFAGNAMTDSATVGSFTGLNSSITITLAESVTVESSLELNLYANVGSFSTYTTVSVNGTSQTANMSLVNSTGSNSGVWKVTGFTGTLTSITLGAQNGANNGISRVIVDGFTLLNGAGDNSFHLNFSDSSTNEALGYDSAVTVPDLNPKKGMDVLTWTGNGSTQNIGGLNFEPGLVWIKERGGTKDHNLYDSIRGATKELFPNGTGTENTLTNGLTSFNPDGFTLGSADRANGSTQTYVGWCWRAGGPAVSNTDGTTTSQVSANTDYGFSIVTYTGGTSDATIGHGLGQTPKFYIAKARTNSGYTDSWNVYHTSLGASAYIKLNDPGGKTTPSTIWNETAPTSTVFSVDANSNANEPNTDYVAYVWSEVAGYSKFGSYTGNGSDDGPFIETGFKPRWILIKSHYASNPNAHSHWLIYDTKRSPSNEADDLLLASGNNAEFSSAHTGIDILENGFKLKADSLGYANFNTNQYIYAAFADRPGNNWDVNNLVTNEGLSTSKNNFDVALWTGDGSSSQSISSLSFQPDLVWLKGRSYNISHLLYDSVRGFGADKELVPNGTNAEGAAGADSTYGYVSAVSSTGFTVQGGSSANDGYTNKSSATYVAWCWKAGGTAVSNTDGSITSSVSANPQYGFSIVSYTGNNTAGATIGHGLSTAPSLVIYKNRDRTESWGVYARAIGASKSLYLHNTSAALTADTSPANMYNSTDPTSSVLTVGDAVHLNANGEDIIAYCFANVPGYQRIGSYTGNGTSTGPVIVTGFKPRFILFKRTNTARDWEIYDTERSGDSNTKALYPNDSAAEGGNAGPIKINSDGFQPLTNSASTNGSGDTYIYLAIGDDEIGSNEDCLVDVPNAVTADAAATDTTGGYQRGNYATINPLDNPGESPYGNQGASITNGNLDFAADGSSYAMRRATVQIPSTGKWYMECTVNGTAASRSSSSQASGFGLCKSNVITDGNAPITDSQTMWLGDSGYGLNFTGTRVDWAGTTVDNGDVISLALDMGANTFDFMVNGVSVQTGTIGTTDPVHPFVFSSSTSYTNLSVNFGQMRFKYPMPSGYAALNTTALPAATIADGSAYFDAKIWTGNGSSQSISGFEFSPDLVWIKQRSTVEHHALYDTIRGATNQLYSNLTNAETTQSTTMTAFNSDGFSVGSDDKVNENGQSHVAWCWDAGSSTVSNTDGSITSSVRANPSAGFSIVTWTGNASNATIGHGLNAAPELILLKFRGSTSNWSVYHSAIGNTKRLVLNSTGSTSASSTYWQNTSPTSSVFSVGGDVNDSTTIVAYCFAPVAGYSAFGSYEGNGSNDGPFVHTGFRPRWLMIKRTDSTSNWVIIDAARSSFNEVNDLLYAEQSLAETVDDGNNGIDFLSNGFKLRKGVGGTNVNGATLIYIAFASNPFQANGGLAR